MKYPLEVMEALNRVNYMVEEFPESDEQAINFPLKKCDRHTDTIVCAKGEHVTSVDSRFIQQVIDLANLAYMPKGDV